MPAVALTDTNGMYAAIPFYKAAMASGHQADCRRKAGCRAENAPRNSQ